MNKNIFKVLLLILLAVSFVKPAKASDNKGSKKKMYMCDICRYSEWGRFCSTSSGKYLTIEDAYNDVYEMNTTGLGLSDEGLKINCYKY